MATMGRARSREIIKGGHRAIRRAGSREIIKGGYRAMATMSTARGTLSRDVSSSLSVTWVACRTT
jgi:hypothetical protein